MPSSRSTTIRLIALLVVTLASLPAMAQQPGEADMALAKQFFQLGKTYYDQGAYQKALDAFKQSYGHSKKPALLYNIAKCYEALGQLEPAIDHYERFLSESGKTSSTISARIRNLKARLAKQQPKEPPTPVLAPMLAVPPPTDPVTQPPADKPAPPKDEPQPAATETQAPTEGSSWMTWTGWTLVGVGVASVVTGIVLGMRAKAKSDLMKDAYACPVSDSPRSDCPANGQPFEWSTAQSEIEDPGKALQAGQIAALVIGGVAAAAGTTLLILKPSGERRTAHLAPMLSQDSVGVSGTFAF